MRAFQSSASASTNSRAAGSTNSPPAASAAMETARVKVLIPASSSQRFWSVPGPLRALRLAEPPPGARNADHLHVEASAGDERLQRGVDLPLGEVAGRVEQQQGVAGGRSFPALLVTAEFSAHRSEHAIGEISGPARGEACEERRGPHRRRRAGVDGSLEGPAAFARIGNATLRAPGQARVSAAEPRVARHRLRVRDFGVEDRRGPVRDLGVRRAGRRRVRP